MDFAPKGLIINAHELQKFRRIDLNHPLLLPLSMDQQPELMSPKLDGLGREGA